MAKICLHCNTKVQDNANFCPTCGQIAFRPMRPEEEFYNQPPTGTGAPVQGAPNWQAPPNGQMPYGTPPYTPPVQKQKKQMQWWQILLIVISSLLVIFSIKLAFDFAAAAWFFKIVDRIDSETQVEDVLPGTAVPERPDASEFPIVGDLESMYGGNSTSDMPYTKGKMRNGVYENVWANLRFRIPEGWREGTAEEYAAYASHEKTEVGFLAVNKKTGQHLLLTFTDMEMEPSVDNDQFLEVYLQNVLERAKKAFEANGVAYRESVGPPTVIGGKYYRSARLDLDDEGLTQSYHVRMLDGYIITFCITTGTGESASDILDQVETIQ